MFVQLKASAVFAVIVSEHPVFRMSCAGNSMRKMSPPLLGQDKIPVPAIPKKTFLIPMIKYMNLSTSSLSTSYLSFVFISGTTVTGIEPWEA